MKVVEHSDAAGFLDATEAYRNPEPIRTNLLGSIATSVLNGRRYDSEQWWTVQDRAGVVGAAVRTAPHHLVVGPMPAPAAVALGDHLRARRQPLPGVNGPAAVVLAVIERLGHPHVVRMRDILRVLDTLIDPAEPEGGWRRADADDVDLVSTWQERFLVEAGLPPHLPDRPTMLQWLERMWLWEADGGPVAMAGHANVVVTAGSRVGRIGPVYTVPQARGRGFGSALTAVVCRVLLDQGATVMLYADADNATSNGVYERLGFRALDEHVEVDLL